MDPQTATDSRGQTYAAFIETELNREYARRDTVNARAAGAVTSATGLVTLTVSAFAIIKGQAHPVHGWPIAGVVVAVLALLVSAGLAVVAGLNWSFEATSVESLTQMITDHRSDSEMAARVTTASCNVTTLKSLRAKTAIKTRFLMAAYGAQTAAIPALAVTLVGVVA
jgi:hypothetical protein